LIITEKVVSKDMTFFFLLNRVQNLPTGRQAYKVSDPSTSSG